MIRKALLTTALAAGMVAGSAGVASAHECFNASRSANGNANATNSSNWETLTLEHLFAGVHGFLQEENGPVMPALTPAQVTEAVEMAVGQGVPSSFAVFHGGMLPRSVETKAPSAKSSDGRGIDHFASGYGDTLIGIYFALISGSAE